jgi:hypothetical protein
MTTNITVTINVNTDGDTQKERDTALSNFQKKMREVARETIAREQRKGGTLWKMAHS